MSYSISGAPGTITATTAGVISGTPVNANVGTHTITVTCADAAGASATDQYVLTVTNTNDAPTLASAQADASTAEDTAYSLDISGNFADVDVGDTLTYTATGMPSTMTMSTAGVLSGTPVNADVGTSTVVVTASDGTATVTDTFDLTVTNTNDAPTVTSTAVLTAAEDSPYSYTVTASDVDTGDTLSMTGTTFPAWSTFTAATGVLAGTPANAHVGDHSVVITISDGTTTVTDTFTITVANTDDATTGTVSITGDTYDDATLTAVTTALADDDGMGTFAYQWANQDGDV